MLTSRPPGRGAPLSGEQEVRDAYAAHGAELHRFVLRATGDRALSEDLVQEVFLRAWRARARYDPQTASLRTWLFAITRNVVVDHVRVRAARPRTRPLAEDEGSTLTDPSDHVHRLMQRWLVEEALRRLGEDHRTALQETYLADRPYDEVAAELGIPVSTLRSRVFYGLKALRLVMDEMEVSA